jgi:hypothetical protein
MEDNAERWDIFCRVVDNYGDVAVSWRLARQVAREHRKNVRLWLDDLTVLAKLRPEIDPAYDVQRLDGVEVARIREPFDLDGVADVVIETFGCDPPESYVLAMAERGIKPRWVNLEYLSAEEWVEGSHALPSPNPRLPLVKHFFFPGFTARTGGLLREESLLRRRDEFQADEGAQAAFWRSIVGAVPPRGPIATFPIPFLAQDRYDELLWACDVNFVRGEDSFVRAQWAARPFVWHPYPQDDGAHWVKLAAFLARYTAGLDRGHAAAVTLLWESWNQRGDALAGEPSRVGLPAAWAGFIGKRPTLEAHAQEWSAGLAGRRGLAGELVDFVDHVLK